MFKWSPVHESRAACVSKKKIEIVLCYFIITVSEMMVFLSLKSIHVYNNKSIYRSIEHILWQKVTHKSR